MKRRWMRLLALVLVLTALSVTASAIDLEQTVTAAGQYGSDNAGKHNYTMHASPVCSYLLKNDLGYLRVELAYDSFQYMGVKDGALFAEQYDENMNFVSHVDLEKELPIFGGFYDDGTYYYMAFGQENPNEDEAAEVFRLVKYTKDWEKLGSVSLYGANTTIPFDAGSLRMAHDGNMLYIHTCHEMYMWVDGKNHQANMMFQVDTAEMSFYFAEYGYNHDNYVSHSFNQYILLDGERLLTLDQGDAYPRCAVLTVMETGSFPQEISLIEYDDQDPEVHYNYTGACIGGLDQSEECYITVGTSVRQDGTVSVYDGQRNVYITATTKDYALETTFNWLTSHPDDADVSVGNPHLVKLVDDRFLVLWTEYHSGTSSLKYTLVDGKAVQISEIYTGTGRLSDCKPILVGDRVVWYSTLRALDGSWGRWMSTVPSFHWIDLNTMEAGHQHRYSYQEKSRPTLETEGEMTGSCLMCDEAATALTLPALNPTDYNYQSLYGPTCTNSGRDVYEYTTEDGLVYLFYTYPSKLGHKVEQPQITPPTHEAYGQVSGVCVRCGEEQFAILSRLSEESVYEVEAIQEPDCTTDGYGIYKYESTTYGVIEVEGTIPKLHHDLVDRDTEKTCTQDGKTETVCTRCGYVFHSYSKEKATGHVFGDWETETEPTETTEGREKRICQQCGEAEYRVTLFVEFTDVSEDAFYAQPVAWAVAEGITKGMTETTFAPGAVCTRAQVVTFLWRAFGEPEPEHSTNPFEDVKEGAYYYKAVLWAVEQGITNGVSETSFAPGDPCTRGHVVTFLHRAMDEPSSQTYTSPFTDVKYGAYYFDAVLWAVEKEVTNGVSETSFAPNSPCTRGQIVTFLYRALA